MSGADVHGPLLGAIERIHVRAMLQELTHNICVVLAARIVQRSIVLVVASMHIRAPGVSARYVPLEQRLHDAARPRRRRDHQGRPSACIRRIDVHVARAQQRIDNLALLVARHSPMERLAAVCICACEARTPLVRMQELLHATQVPIEARLVQRMVLRHDRGPTRGVLHKGSYVRM